MGVLKLGAHAISLGGNLAGPSRSMESVEGSTYKVWEPPN